MDGACVADMVRCYRERITQEVATNPTLMRKGGISDYALLYTEAFQRVIWHLLVPYPDLKQCATKWESVAAV